MQHPQRTTVRGPTFIRLLARLTDVDAPKSSTSLSDRLSQWLDWTQAIALSGALDGVPTASSGDASTFAGDEEAECARARTALAELIAGPRGAGVASADASGVEATLDYGVFRRRYLAMQRAIQAETGNLRGRLRDVLARTSDGMARLAEVDAVMELTLSPREQTVLAVVPTLLEKHFNRLRDAGGSTPGGAWLNVFRKDMQGVLLAERDVRFQPVEALLAALRAS